MEKYFNVNKNKYSVRCKLYCDDPKNVNTVVIFEHGFSGHKDNKAAEKLAKRAIEKNKGFALICFNLPCHGDDARKKLTVEESLEYLQAVIDYVDERWKNARKLSCATSFGGYLLLTYVARNGNPFEKIVFRCPAVTMYNVITNTIITADDLKKIEKGKCALVGFDRKIEIGKDFLNELKNNDITANDYSAYAEKTLIIHGTADEVVPFEDSKAFAEKNGIEFIPVEGADHRFQDPYKMNFAIAKILDFFGLK